MVLNKFVVICLVLLLSACKKEDDSFTVSYIINRTKGSSDFSVSYKKAGGADELLGSINQQNWNSGLLEGFKQGELASITINTAGQNEDYLVKIIANGNTIKVEEIVSANSSQTISTGVY